MQSSYSKNQFCFWFFGKQVRTPKGKHIQQNACSTVGAPKGKGLPGGCHDVDVNSDSSFHVYFIIRFSLPWTSMEDTGATCNSFLYWTVTPVWWNYISHIFIFLFLILCKTFPYWNFFYFFQDILSNK